MSQLIIQAGPRALAHLRREGLRPEDVSIVPGAAGGPKGLGLARLDEWLFADWLPQGFATRAQPIDLIGASIGAWRFAAVCRGYTQEGFSAAATRLALQHFAKAYCEQVYPRRVTSAYITAYARDLIDGLFVGHIDRVLSHPHYRLHVLTVRGKGVLARETRGRTQAGYALAALANTAGRQYLRHFMDRVWFHAGADEKAKLAIWRAFSDKSASKGSPNGEFDNFHTDYVRLTEANFARALIASGSIPLVLDGVTDIEDAPVGTYWDGGIIDYHLHLPYAAHEGVVLYPHFTDRIIPGWLDKMLPWRKAHGAWLDNVVLVSPSREYLARLPHGKLPDRKDFNRYVDDPEARFKYWRFAMDESARLRDEFAALIQRGELGARATLLR
jgi:hypothetical protein